MSGRRQGAGIGGTAVNIVGPQGLWSTALDLDFSAQATQSLATNGAYTIAGLPWTKLNSSGDATAMALTNGTGLVITPTKATNITNSTFSSPTLQVPLVNLVPQVTAATPLRIWIYVSSDNAAANFDQTLWGLYVYNAAYSNQIMSAAWKGWATNNGWGSQIIILDTNVLGTSPAAAITGQNAGLLSFPTGFTGGTYPVTVGTYASGWPAVASMQMATIAAATSAASGSISNASSGPNSIASVNLFLTALRGGTSNTAYQSTIARLRVDYQPIY